MAISLEDLTEQQILLMEGRFQLPSDRTASQNIQALLGIWTNLQAQGQGRLAITSSPRRSVWHQHNDGSILTYKVPDDCDFVGCACPNGELFVATQMTIASDPISGPSGIRPNLLGYCNVAAGMIAGLVRTPVSAGTTLYFNTNSGPRMSLMVFEPR